MDIYSKNVVEFVTVALEYCAYLEKAGDKSFKNFVSVMQKILPLLYLKTSLVEKPLPNSDSDPAGYVTEIIYNSVLKPIETLLGSHDAFFDGEEAGSIAENLCDIYQDLKDFTECYRQGNHDLSENALFNCIDNFETYWGRRLISTQAALHEILYNSDLDEPSDRNNSGNNEDDEIYDD